MPHRRLPTIAGFPPTPRGVLGSRQRLAVVLAAVVLLSGTLTVFGRNGVVHLLGLRADRITLSERAFALMHRNAELRDRIVRLHEDDRYLEDIAREKLGLVRDDEIIYKFGGIPPHHQLHPSKPPPPRASSGGQRGGGGRGRGAADQGHEGNRQ